MMTEETAAVTSALPLIFASCSPSGKKEKVADQPVQKVSIEVNKEAALLLKHLEVTGDYVNTRNFPSLVKASVVHDELTANNHIIDLRSSDLYKKGHIRGSVNVLFEALPEYLETKIRPFEYGKIILVCYRTGFFLRCFPASVRLGYGMFMPGDGNERCNKASAADFWMKGITSAFENRLDTVNVEPALPADLPLPNTGKTTGEEILNDRFRKVISEGSEAALPPLRKCLPNPEIITSLTLNGIESTIRDIFPEPCDTSKNGTRGFYRKWKPSPRGKQW